MDEKVAGDLLIKLTRKYGEDIAQGAMLRILNRGIGPDILDLEDYAYRTAEMLRVDLWRRRPRCQGEAAVFVSAEEWHGVDHATPLRRAEARQELERVDPTILRKAILSLPLTNTERSRKHRQRKTA